jgi:hypothetical protein
MPEDPIALLRRWEDHGAVWRVAALRDEHVSLDLCACTGERVDVLDSDDPELIAFVRERLNGDAP